MGDNETTPKIDIKDVKTLIQLLAVFLIISEALMALWFLKAESAIERALAGTLFAILMIIFLAVAYYLAKSDKFLIPQAEGLPPLKINPELPSTSAPTLPKPHQIIGPDKSYTINKPPEDWIMQEMNFEEWVSQNISSKPETLREILPQLGDPNLKIRDILQFRSPKIVSIVPVPGITTINGIRWPTALENQISSSITILPMNRYFNSNFSENSFIHKFITVVGQSLSSGIISLVKFEEQTNVSSKQTIRLAQTRQEIRNAIVNGTAGKNIDGYSAIYGIEGETQEHLIIFRYVKDSDTADPLFDKDLETMTALFKSFQPAQPIDPDQNKRELGIRFKTNLKKWISLNGKSIFWVEFAVVMGKISDWDLQDADFRLKAIRLLKPFKNFADCIQLKNEKLDNLWNAIDQAEKGNADLFYQCVEEQKKEQQIHKFTSTLEFIGSLDLNDLDSLTKTVQILIPFKPLIESESQVDTNMQKLQEALDSAEKGNLQSIRDFFLSLNK